MTVIVGRDDDKVEFNFPKGLLCSRSKWFEKAFREGRFVEGRARTITLPDDPPSAFMAFEYYIYTNDLSFLDLTSPSTRHHVDFSSHLQHCFEVWVLADKYYMPGLQNAVMLRACEVLKSDRCTKITDEMLAFCFQNTTRGSPLRTIAADYIVRCIEDDGQCMEDFDAVSGLDGVASEIYKAKTAYHITVGHFPRYSKAVKNEHLLLVDDSAAIPSDTLQGYSRWRDSTLCEECGLWDADVRCRVGCMQNKCCSNTRNYRVICDDCLVGTYR